MQTLEDITLESYLADLRASIPCDGMEEKELLKHAKQELERDAEHFRKQADLYGDAEMWTAYDTCSAWEHHYRKLARSIPD